MRVWRAAVVVSCPNRKIHKFDGRTVDTSCRIGPLTAALTILFRIGDPKNIIASSWSSFFFSVASVASSSSLSFSMNR